MFQKLSLIVLLAVSTVCYSQIPTYYNDVNLNLTGTALRDELATKVISTHTTFLSYGWPVIQQTDLDPNNSANVFLIYGSNDTDGDYVTDRTRSLNSNGGTAGTDWNREHIYPKSLGNPNLGTSGPGADVHHLRASDVTMNSNRGSLKFITGTGIAAVTGAGWYPGDEWKGDVARMMMYMYIRYGTRCLPSNVAFGNTNTIDADMIDLLLDWNAEDPISQYETNRNAILETEQGNRNPFIDNPAFATTIWGGQQAEDVFTGNVIEKEINITGNGNTIANGLIITNLSNNTDFGAIASSSGTIIKTFTIQNTGGTTLTLSGNPTISTGNAADFSVTTNPSLLALVAGASTNFQITFDPRVDGIRTTTVTVLSDDADEATYTFNISGAGTSDGGSGGGSCGTELFISEYIEGSGSNKYIEIYNPTNTSVNLANYDLVIYNNGASSINNTLNLTGSIASKSTFVIENSAESLTVTADLSTTSSVLTFNGDDVIALRKSTVLIDVIGEIGEDPGSRWPGSCGSVNITLIRNAAITTGDSDGTSAFTTDTEWSCTSTDDVSNLGSHTITCGSPEIDVEGNLNPIPNGATVTNTNNNTDFGSADTASETIVKTFTIKNLGSSLLTLSGNPTISSGNASDFTVSSNPILTITSANSTTFQITFNPNADGLRTTTVSISSDDADEPLYTFNVSGTGTTNSGAACGSELFISEYVEGSNQNKFLEIYNPTGTSVNLSDYDIVLYVNGSSSISQTQALSGSIASLSTFVIENDRRCIL